MSTSKSYWIIYPVGQYIEVTLDIDNKQKLGSGTIVDIDNKNGQLTIENTETKLLQTFPQDTITGFAVTENLLNNSICILPFSRSPGPLRNTLWSMDFRLAFKPSYMSAKAFVRKTPNPNLVPDSDLERGIGIGIGIAAYIPHSERSSVPIPAVVWCDHLINLMEYYNCPLLRLEFIVENE